MAILGNYFGIYFGGQRVLMAKGGSVNIKTDVVDITNNDSGLFQEVKPVRNSLSGSVDAIYCSAPGNLLQFPEALDNAVWTKSGCTVSSTKSLAPNGIQHLAQSLTGFAAGDYIRQEVATPLSAGVSAGFSTWVSGTGVIELSIDDGFGNNTAQAVTLTSTLTRVSVVLQITEDDSLPIVTITSTTATALTIFGPQLEANADGIVTDYKGSTYLYQLLQQAEIDMTALDMIYTTSISGDLKITGQCYISGLDTKTKEGDVIMFTANINGTGLQQLATI